MADGSLSHLKLSWGSCFGIEAYFIGSATSDTSSPTVLGSDVWYGFVSGWLALADRCLGPRVGLGLLHSTHIPSSLLSHPQSSLEAVSSHTCRATISVADQHWGVGIRRQSPGHHCQSGVFHLGPTVNLVNLHLLRTPLVMPWTCYEICCF